MTTKGRLEEFVGSRAGSPEEVGADWLQRLDDPDLKEEVLQAWIEWFDASEAHRRIFEELYVLRQRLRAMPDDYRCELKQRTGTEVVDAGIGGNDSGQRLGLAPRCDLPGRGGVEDRADFPVRKRRAPVRAGLAIAASVCVISLSLGTWWILDDARVATFAAPAEHHRSVTLADGSLLVLSANSLVDVAYSRGRRSLSVQRGEAYFEVKHDAERPFVVEAGGVRVTAVGTAFNMHREADQVTVTVIEGRVTVAAGERRPEPATVPANGRRDRMLLGVGQHAVLPLQRAAATGVVGASNATHEWENGRADFINSPLSEVLPLVNRYASTKLVIDDPRVADLTYSGTIFRNHIDEWIASLPLVYAIRRIPLDDGTDTLVSQDTSGPRP